MTSGIKSNLTINVEKRLTISFINEAKIISASGCIKHHVTE